MTHAECKRSLKGIASENLGRRDETSAAVHLTRSVRLRECRVHMPWRPTCRPWAKLA